MNYIKLQFRIRRLLKAKEKVDKDYTKVIKNVTDQDEFSFHNSNLGQKLTEIDDSINYLRSNYLCGIANELLIPLPDKNNKEMWEEVGDPSEDALSLKGVSLIKQLIRKERKERIEYFAIIIAMLTGLIGVITGFFAVILK